MALYSETLLAGLAQKFKEKVWLEDTEYDILSSQARHLLSEAELNELDTIVGWGLGREEKS